jgi:hypothetical protein|nr:MAG TPA: CW7 repeat protein [Bacteriophage sp.]
MKKVTSNLKNFIINRIDVLIVASVIIISSVFLIIGKPSEDGSITLDGSKAKYSKATEKALCELAKKRETAIAGIMGLDVPQDAGSGCEAPDKELAQMGSGVYYKTDLSSPAAFVNTMNGRGFNEGYGFQAHSKYAIIKMADGSVKRVTDLRTGDKVTNSSGTKVNTVKDLWTSDNKIYRMRTTAGDLMLSGEHPVLAVKMSQHQSDNLQRDLATNPDKYKDKFAWTKTEDISKFDRIAVTIPASGTRSNLTDSELRLVGYWLGDGDKVYYHKNSNAHGFRITSNDEKKAFIDSLGLNITWTKHSNGKAWAGTIHPSDELRKVLDSLGRYSSDKQFPHNFAAEQNKLVLEGYIKAGGHEKRANNYVISSTSKTLLTQMQAIAWQNGYNASIQLVRKAGTETNIGKSNYDLWQLNVNTKPVRKQITFISGIPTVSVVNNDVLDEEKTYYIETDGDHTYIADNHQVHNCVAGFKQFMFSLSGRVVATRTGGASGYANQVGEIQALGFTWHAGQAGMKDGDWAIFGGGQYGHVAMYYQGKFFGQNQGSGNIYVGNAFNLMDLGGYRNSIIGYYRPNIWAGNSSPSTPAPQANNSKSVNDQVVADVLKGVYGSGNDRVARLQAAGYNPTEVQAAVNSRVAAQAPRISAPASTGYVQRSAGGYVVRRGDTLGHIALRNGWHGTNGLFGNSGYTQALANKNGIANRGLIHPGQKIQP